MSRPVLDRLEGTAVEVLGRRTVERPGVPEDLEVYVVGLDGARNGN